MTDTDHEPPIEGEERHDDRAPGEEGEGEGEGGHAAARGIRTYLIGLALAGMLTAASFSIPGMGLLWAPGIPMALVALAVAQMGVHLVFFLHVTSGPDNTNNLLALAFGVLIVVLVLAGSIWIMAHLHHNLMSSADMMRMQR